LRCDMIVLGRKSHRIGARRTKVRSAPSLSPSAREIPDQEASTTRRR
jgi:hypothetical protein